MKFYIHTLGCKVNQYESEKIRTVLEQGGFESADHPAGVEVVIVNSCTVTAESDRKTRQLVRRFRRLNPGAAVVLTGCMPQAFPEAAGQLPADIIVGNGSDRDILKNVQDYLTHRQRIVDIHPHLKGERFETGGIEQFSAHTRAYMKIEDGCDRGCTYCIIPKARGRVRSRTPEQILQEAHRLAENGFCELVLVGINLSAYGADLGLTLADAVEAAAAPAGILRVRLGSVEPDLTDAALLDRLAQSPKFCPQFHLALQSGCDSTLKRMNRLYDSNFYRQTVREIRRRFPSAAITTDVMVGFAGESAEEFEKSLAFCREMQFLKAHVFPYSVRTGTAAATFSGQVPEETKASRAAQMAAVCHKAARALLQTFVGATAEVLFEAVDENGYSHGHSRNFMPVYVKGGQSLLYTVKQVRLTALYADGMLGELIEDEV